MTLLKRNITANLAGNIWQSLMGLSFIPLQIHFMGVESYGLIGIFATLQSMLAILDMGLSATLTREMARLSALPGNHQQMRNLVRTLEAICWGIAIAIGIAVAGASNLIATYWISSDRLSPETLESSLRIMGVAAALQWPSSLYSGGLMGLQRQVLLNTVNIGAITFRHLGAVMALWLISPTVQVFLLWQVIGCALNTCCLAQFFWRRLPSAPARAGFRVAVLRGIWRFAAGMTGITILSTILTQLDKIMLSRMLSLEAFGYYTLAGVAAMSLYRVIAPVLTAVYPRMTQLASLGDLEKLKKLYHESCQFMSVLIFPPAVVAATFSYEIMCIWTQNPVTAENSSQLLSVIVCGTALNGLLNIPYGLQLAYGWTLFSIVSNCVAIAFLVPSIAFLTTKFGAMGGASAWVILNGCYLLIGIPLMHRRLLPTEKWRWYFQDVGLPLAASLFIPFMGRLVTYRVESQWVMFLVLFIVFVLTLTSAAITTRTTRSWIFNRIAAIRISYANVYR
jgi:O-antigen/teichoic acid export membrane protein